MRRHVCYAAVIAILLGTQVAQSAGDITHFAIGPRSTLVLNGTSNIADWRCTGTTMEAAIAVAAPVEKINDVIDRIENGDISRWMSNPADGRLPQPQIQLTIPIATLRCSGGRPMENDMTRTLRANQFPEIAFQFAGIRSGINHDIDRRQFQATIAGQLSLAGVTREIAFTANARRISRTQFRLTADMPVRMTDFRITPPKALFGMIRAADDLSVRLDLTVEVAP